MDEIELRIASMTDEEVRDCLLARVLEIVEVGDPYKILFDLGILSDH